MVLKPFFYWEVLKNIEDRIRKHPNKSQFINFFYNEEFDPGSGWTLAAGLTHASRTVTDLAC